MRVKVQQIRWHFNLEKNFPTPVFGVDFHTTKENVLRLATCGLDNTAKTWVLREDEKKDLVPEFRGELTHSSGVNIVRFSPNGRWLATGTDAGTAYVWQLGEQTADGEQWTCAMSLNGHTSEVYDLAWAPSSSLLMTGSLDNTAIVWELQETDGGTWKGRNIQHLKDHKQFVQGVAWHPGGKQIASQSSDGSVRMYGLSEKKKAFTSSHTASKLLLSAGTEHERAKYARLYVEDVKATFFRRLTYSPDGALLVTPTGFIADSSKDSSCNCFYIYRTLSPSSPVARVGASTATAIAARFNPCLFKPRTTTTPPLFEGLAARMIYAVATADTCLLFDTQQREPFASLAHLHLAPLTDLAWAPSGRVLAIASQDGFVSLVSFDPCDFDPAAPATATMEDITMDPASVQPVAVSLEPTAAAGEGVEAELGSARGEGQEGQAWLSAEPMLIDH